MNAASFAWCTWHGMPCWSGWARFSKPLGSKTPRRLRKLANHCRVYAAEKTEDGHEIGFVRGGTSTKTPLGNRIWNSVAADGLIDTGTKCGVLPQRRCRKAPQPVVLASSSDLFLAAKGGDGQAASPLPRNHVTPEPLLLTIRAAPHRDPANQCRNSFTKHAC